MTLYKTIFKQIHDMIFTMICKLPAVMDIVHTRTSVQCAASRWSQLPL